MKSQYNEAVEMVKNMKAALDRIEGLLSKDNSVEQHKVVIRLEQASSYIESACEVVDHQ